MLIYLQIWIITFTTISLSPHFVLSHLLLFPVPFDDDEDRSLVLWRPQWVELQSFYFFCESEGRYSFHFLPPSFVLFRADETTTNCSEASGRGRIIEESEQVHQETRKEIEKLIQPHFVTPSSVLSSAFWHVPCSQRIKGMRKWVIAWVVFKGKLSTEFEIT